MKERTKSDSGWTIYRLRDVRPSPFMTEQSPFMKWDVQSFVSFPGAEAASSGLSFLGSGCRLVRQFHSPLTILFGAPEKKITWLSLGRDGLPIFRSLCNLETKRTWPVVGIVWNPYLSPTGS
jgi:hypothetical protein